MKSSIKQFLADLYEIDPTLKTHQAELVPMLEKLLAQDPAMAPDAAFVARLRRQLNEKAAVSEALPAGSFWSKFAYAFGGAVTAAVIIPVAIIATNQKPMNPGSPLFSNSVEAVSKNAFGSLNSIGGTVALESESARSFRPQSGGGGPPSIDAATTANMAYGDVDPKMIAPWPMVTYRYVYSGSIAGLTPSVDVYKRVTKPMNIPMSSIGGLNFGGLNLGSFAGMNVDSLSFTQRTPFGYQIYVNLRDSSVSVDANWEQWPQSKCQTESCWQAERVKIGDVPSDDVVIGIAEAFAKDHGIDLSEFGEPVVDNNWRRDYERTADKDLAWVPDTQRVVFPQLIDGEVVHDQGGMPTGLSISVHVKHRKVMNVYGIADRSYQKSEYAGVTDEALIRKFIQNVDNYGYDPAVMMRAEGGTQPDIKKMTVTLGEPTIGYSVYYRYTTGVNEELLIPSLIFPVDSVQGETKDSWYYRQTVVVPLAQEMLDEQSNIGRPMPLTEPAVEDQGDAAVSDMVDEPAVR